MKRRALIQFTTASASSILMNQILLGCSHLNNTETIATDSIWRMPDESEPHERTWMAFGASPQIWGNQLLPEVQN
ncbi:MAG: agmatine deiminase family protein, partial [Cyanobacteria bacterium J06632_3]